ncbi:MAG: hypothetical protein IJC74_04830 [Clostridia bacterium]|nr:hypothetical protein [Clostridia bacterium]
MKNKIICLILSFVMIFSCMASANVQSPEIKSLKYGKLLEKLDIIKADKYSADEYVTRKEFIMAAIGLYGNNKLSYLSSERANTFKDVLDGSDLYPYVLAALDMGLVSESTAFRPDEKIELAEAVKILVALLGYAPLADVTGGYPTGYYSLALTTNLLKGVNTSDVYVNGADFEKLMVNALCAHTAEFNPYSDNDVNISVNTGKLLMEQSFNMFEAEGIIDADAFTSLLSPEGLANGQLRINGKIYETSDKALEQMLGNYVEFFYLYNEDTNKSEIIFASAKESLNKSVSVLPEDIVVSACSESDFAVEDANDNVKNYRLSANTSYIYNNVLKARSEVNLSIETGSVELIDNNGDNVFEVVKVFEYSSMVVTGISIHSKTIMGKENTVIKLEDENDYYYIEKKGEEIPFEEIKVDDVISYYETKNNDRYVRKLYVSENIITASSDNIDEEYVWIDGEQYGYLEAVKDKILIGTQQKYYIDVFGKIVWVASDGSEYVYGYLRGLARNGLDGYKAKIFTENDRWVTLKLRNKIRTNNDLMKSDEEFFNSMTASDYHQLIKYKVNSNAELVEVLTAVDIERWSDEEFTAIENDTFRRSAVLENNLFRGGTNSMSADVYFGAGEKVFYVPDDIGDESSYAIITVSQFFDYDENVEKLELYDMNRLGIAKACVLRHSNLGKTYSDMFVLEKVLDSLNSDGGKNYTLNGMFRKYNLDFATAGTDVLNGVAPKAGDIYSVAFNSNGEIIRVSKKYDISKGTEQKFLEGNEYDTKGFIAGEIVDVDFEKNKIAVDYGAKTSVFDLSILGNVYLCDAVREKNMNGSKGDLLPGKYIFAKMSYLRLQEVVIFE